jgi:hypothetical protein
LIAARGGTSKFVPDLKARGIGRKTLREWVGLRHDL